jgi:hypothetical protein
VDLQTFERSLTAQAPPAGVADLLVALWHERRCRVPTRPDQPALAARSRSVARDWTRAHEIAQDIETAEAAWVHAYLHRREGDQSNAAYWYRRAGKPVARGSLDEEWRAIVSALLAA